MNSNRKRNLKKLARNIITTTAMASSLNSAGANATETQSSPGISKSAIMTSAALLAGCAGIAGLNYYSDRKRTDADDKHRERMYQLKKAEADARLKTLETQKLLENHGLTVPQITTLVNSINYVRQLNLCESFITSDDVIKALETGGPTTVAMLKDMIQQGGVPGVVAALTGTISDKLTADNGQLGKMENALRTLIAETTTRDEMCNSLFEVTGNNALGFFGRWDWFGMGGGGRSTHLGLNGVSYDILLSHTHRPFVFRQSNYDAGTQLLPDALKPLFGDTLWCGVACGRPAVHPQHKDELDLNAVIIGPDVILETLQNDQAKKTIQTGNMPMYLVVSVTPNLRDGYGYLNRNAGTLVPLFENSRDNRGGKDKTDLRKIVGNWLLSNVSEQLKSNRAEANNNDFT